MEASSFLGYRERLQVASVSSAMDKNVYRCSVVRDACGEEGVLVPKTFCYYDRLKVLFWVVRKSKGIPWTLQCEEAVHETIFYGCNALEELDSEKPCVHAQRRSFPHSGGRSSTAEV